MQVLLSPAIFLLNRLNFRAKFALILVLASLFGLFLMSQIHDRLSEEIALTRQEMRGLNVYPEAIKALILMQQHRGLTAGLLGGGDTLRPKVAAKAAALDVAIAEFDTALDGPGEAFGLRARWGDIKRQWPPLRDAGDSFSQTENFSLHSHMVRRMLELIIALGDSSALAIDSQPAAIDLIQPLLRTIPEATERLGRLRGKATGIVARGRLADGDGSALVSQLAELGVTAGALADRINRAAVANPADADALRQANQEIAAAIEVFRETATAEVVAERFAIEPAELFALGTAAIDTVLKHLHGSFLPAATGVMDARLERLEARRARDLGVSGAALVLLGYALVAMYRAILGSVRELSLGARQLAGGDYTTRVAFSARDELSEVADQFNNMITSLGGLVSQVKGQAGELVEAAACLSGAAGKITEGSQQQSESAAAMAASIQQVTVGISEIAQHAGSAEERSEQSGGVSREGGLLAAQTVSEMERIAAAVEQSAAAITQLGEQSGRISEIVDTIREIADQTNLLALNAAIEAARAGESGRGFAVVADEVRKLAERTAGATGEISSMVGAIQDGTRHAVVTMDDGVSRVRDGVTLSTRCGSAMEQIHDSATQVVRAVHDIGQALREQGSTSDEIAQRVEQIAQHAAENHRAVQEAAQTAARVEAVSATLMDQVSRFRV